MRASWAILQVLLQGILPKLSPVKNPTTEPGYKPVQMPMPTPQPATYNPNSLWRNGSRAFFNDQRAHQVGDILHREGQRQRHRGISGPDAAHSQHHGRIPTSPISSVPIPSPTPPRRCCQARCWRPTAIPRCRATAPSTARISWSPTSAAVVTQVLPNGNLVIEGKQEIRLNSEMRELKAGVARPEDIQSDNTIDLPRDRREARVAYGGKGALDEHPDPAVGTAGDQRHIAVLSIRFPSSDGRSPRGSQCAVLLTKASAST